MASTAALAGRIHASRILPRRFVRTTSSIPRGATDSSDPLPSTLHNLTPSVVVVGGIDWRFADPEAEVLTGFKFSKLAVPPLARSMIAELSKHQGLLEADLQKILAGLSGVDQVALSAREGHVVMMVAGRAEDSILPALKAGLKAMPVVGNALLIGDGEAVDQAVQRISNQGPVADSTRLAAQQAANSEFWTIGSGTLAGPQAVNQGLKRFLMTASFRDGFTGDAALEFDGAPAANALKMWPAAIGAATIDGNVIHVRVSMEADKAEQSFGQIVDSSIGQPLMAFVKVAQYLPVYDANAQLRTKPVIYGLDSGPREVK